MNFLKLKWHALFALLIICQQLVAEPWQQKRKPLVPGVVHISLYDPHRPRSIHVLEIDLSLPSVDLTSVKARDRLQGNEQISKQIKHHHQIGKHVVAAVNADFYGLNGVPVGIQVIEGIPLKDPSSHPVFALTATKMPLIEVVSLNGEIHFHQFKRLQINGINRIRNKDEIILYNRYRGTTTKTNAWGTEITLRYLNSFIVGEFVECQVTAIANSGNQPIPAFNGAILSAHGKAALQFQQQFQLQDTVSLKVELPPIKQPVNLVVGGLPRIIRDGKISIELAAEGVPTHFSSTRHPRTAIGYSRDGKKLFLVTVDGRQPSFSIGMSLPELADFMVELGCYQALNLDGGGSTTMVIGNKVVNSPSDPTGERAVANSLIVLSSIPLPK